MPVCCRVLILVCSASLVTNKLLQLQAVGVTCSSSGSICSSILMPVCYRVLILVCSASLLTYKLLQLQARLDASLRGWSPAAGEAASTPSLSQLHGFVVVVSLV